jgi:hypothetical protein
MLSDSTCGVEQKALLPSSRCVLHDSKSSLPLWVQVLILPVSNIKGKMRHCTAPITKIDITVVVSCAEQVHQLSVSKMKNKLLADVGQPIRVTGR